MNLMHLSTWNYASVRIRAQDTLRHMTSSFAYSYKVVLDPLLELLSSENDEEKVTHEAFKGKLNFHTLIFFKVKSNLDLREISVL